MMNTLCVIRVSQFGSKRIFAFAADADADIADDADADIADDAVLY